MCKASDMTCVVQVTLLGDSAGANLVMYAAALLSNPPLLEEFCDWLKNYEGLYD